MLIYTMVWKAISVGLFRILFYASQHIIIFITQEMNGHSGFFVYRVCFGSAS